MDKETLFKRLISSYTGAHPGKNGKQIQLEVSYIWKGLKKEKDLQSECQKKVQEWSSVALSKKAGLLKFWAKVSIYLIGRKDE